MWHFQYLVVIPTDNTSIVWDLRFSQRWLWSVLFSATKRHVDRCKSTEPKSHPANKKKKRADEKQAASWSSMFLENVGFCPNYTALQPRRPHYSQLHEGESVNRSKMDICGIIRGIIISQHILHQHWYTCPIGLVVRRNRQHRSLDCCLRHFLITVSSSSSAKPLPCFSTQLWTALRDKHFPQ
jgi:hypothetical protein